MKDKSLEFSEGNDNLALFAPLIIASASNPQPITITFDADVIELKERGVVILSQYIHDFLAQFDEIIFKDSEGKATTYKRVS